MPLRIVLSFPNGDGTFTPAMAMTSNDVAETVTTSIAGVAQEVYYSPNRIGSVGEMANRIDISQAKGGVPQAIEWSFTVIDWDGFERVSTTLFDGTARFVGWEVTVLLPGTSSSVDLAVLNAAAGQDSLSFNCISRFELVNRLCAFGASDNQVGLVVGGHDVSVPTNGAAEPIKITRNVSSTLFTGNPSAATVFINSSDTATSKVTPVPGDDERLFFFACADKPTANAFLLSLIEICQTSSATISGNEITNNLSISGGVGSFRTFSITTFPGNVTTWGVVVSVSQDFYDTESSENVRLYKASTEGAICAGASRIIGFEQDGRVSIPEGDNVISGGVLTFKPSNLLADGFASYSIIPATITWRPEGIYSPNAYRKYYGDTANIRTDGVDPGEFDDYSETTLDPVSPTRFTIWSEIQSPKYQLAELPLEVYTEPLEWKPDRIFVDMKARFVAKNVTISADSLRYDFPYTKATPTDTPKLLPGESFSRGFALSGAGFKNSDLKFSSIEDVNASGAYSVRTTGAASGSLYANFQLLAVVIYGQTTLSFGANQAVVTPGAGPLDAPEGAYPARQTGGVTLPEAAACILSANGYYPQNTGNYPASTLPTWTPAASAVGQYLPPTVSFIEAAEKLAQDSWAVFALDYIAGTGEPLELPETPSIELGQDTDVITEPSIEFKSFGGTYLARAYIANVDREFDATNPSAFYGGWGTAPAGAEEAEGTEYGYLIWQRCRAAYKAHGIKRGQAYQFDGIHDAQTMGRMWWESKRNDARRIDWLAFHPRYMTFSIKKTSVEGWAGTQMTLPQSMATFAGYDVSEWGPTQYADRATAVAVSVDPMAMTCKITVALPPIVSDGHDTQISTDTVNNALPLTTDTLDSGLPLTTDTLEG